MLCRPCSGAHDDLWKEAEGNSIACVLIKQLWICCSCPHPCSGAHDDLWKEAEGTLVALFSPKASRSPNISSKHNSMPCSLGWRAQQMPNACICAVVLLSRGPHLPRALARFACIQRNSLIALHCSFTCPDFKGFISHSGAAGSRGGRFFAQRRLSRPGDSTE